TANTLRMQPTAALAADAQYQGTVSTAARDASDPGNSHLAPHVWSFRTANTPPVASIGQPGAGVRWPGGTAPAVVWSATDADEPSSALSVWVNYSLTGSAPWTAIAGPVPGDTGTTPWTVPAADVATARVDVTVEDSGGARASALSSAFAIDSTPPTAQATNPADGAPAVPVNANIVITFSEPMNEGMTGIPAVVGLQPVSGGAWVTLAFTWDPSSAILTADPVANLAPLTSYRLFVNGSAQDASDPGLAMGTGVTADFTTSAVADTAPPQIADVAADPATQTVGGVVEVSANVTDDVAVSAVAANVTLPDASTVNQTMALGAGSRYAFSGPWTQVGAHAFVVWASDTSGNWASASGSFTTTAADTTPPVIAHTQPAGPHYVGAEIRIRVTVTDAGGLAQVRIDYVDSA
ncbi:MAG: Ig-like domain-containing protein, partial [Candidatus Thermoplasmatota archaeon]